jgi:hypothetical protein
MTKDLLMKKLEAAVTEAERLRMFGTLEVEFRAGEPVFFRKHQQEKLDTTENRDDRQIYRR